jgi:predicted kinase
MIMNRLVIMTVGKTHSGKTTFAKEVESILQQAIVIDQDNHAEFINKHYKKLRPNEGPNTLKFTITNTIVEYATEQSNLHIILSNSNLYKQGRANVLHYFHEKGFRSIIVYFELPIEILIERAERTQRSKAIFRSASSFMEVLERQEKSKQEKPTKGEATYLFVIKNPEEITEVFQQIKEISGTK